MEASELWERWINREVSVNCRSWDEAKEFLGLCWIKWGLKWIRRQPCTDAITIYREDGYSSFVYSSDGGALLVETPCMRKNVDWKEFVWAVFHDDIY